MGSNNWTQLNDINNYNFNKGDKVKVSFNVNNNNFTLNPNVQHEFVYTINGVDIYKNRFNLNNLHTKEVNYTFLNGKLGPDNSNGPQSRRMIIGWIGKNKDHPEDGDFRISSFFYKNKNYGFLKEKEMGLFIKYFIQNINHGPEINDFGSISLDNPNLATPGLAGQYSDDRFKRHSVFSPTNGGMPYLWLDTNNKLNTYKIDENEFHNLKIKRKFDILSQIMQHEYHHYVQRSYMLLKDMNKKSENIQYKSFDHVSDTRLNYLPVRLYNDLRIMFGLSLKPLDLSEVDFNISTAIKNYNRDPSDHNKKILREIYFSQMINVDNTLDKIKITVNHQKTSTQQGKEIYIKDLNRYDNFILLVSTWDSNNQEYLLKSTIANQYLLDFDETAARLIQISTGYGSSDLMSFADSYDFFKFAVFDLNMFHELKKGALNIDNDPSISKQILGFANENELLLNLKKNNGNNILVDRVDGFKERFEKWYVENLMGYKNEVSYMRLNSRGKLSLGGYLPEGKNYKLLVSLDNVFDDNDTKIALTVGQTVQRFKDKYIESVFDRPVGKYNKKYWYAKNIDEGLWRLRGKFNLSFWDDVNNDNHVDKNEIVPIKSVNGFYDNNNEMTASIGSQLGDHYLTSLIKTGNQVVVTTNPFRKK